MTQKQALLAYLKKNGKGITTWVAFDQLGISSLHSRIRDLIAMGYSIKKTRVHGTNRYNNPCVVIRYSLDHDYDKNA